MKPQLIRRPAASHGTGLTDRQYVAAPRARFFLRAGSSVDLLTLVVAEALKRRADNTVCRLMVFTEARRTDAWNKNPRMTRQAPQSCHDRDLPDCRQH
ncbi:hypothetical protein OKW43_002065 [Paraburkholderia sp. WC7.3g]|uniref:Uncharacterized protein n=1 Tax=Paraburkholderia podalyriae TaxID=1938811 RepID=A0ABR7PLA3_9BURK|nr:hypothetical protein [Paraburkholderia podalyriae]MBC8747071.1 hypothetical protein [Paraburkholderia podalyriae]